MSPQQTNVVSRAQNVTVRLMEYYNRFFKTNRLAKRQAESDETENDDAEHDQVLKLAQTVPRLLDVLAATKKFLNSDRARYGRKFHILSFNSISFRAKCEGNKDDSIKELELYVSNTEELLKSTNVGDAAQLRQKLLKSMENFYLKNMVSFIDRFGK